MKPKPVKLWHLTQVQLRAALGVFVCLLVVAFPFLSNLKSKPLAILFFFFWVVPTVSVPSKGWDTHIFRLSVFVSKRLPAMITLPVPSCAVWWPCSWEFHLGEHLNPLKTDLREIWCVHAGSIMEHQSCQVRGIWVSSFFSFLQTYPNESN